ncbi:MAG: hypothetical protein E7342_05200 [Clostridiales bacterium]|nr:hypothetical protein [Clostridiales bacterium]
MCDENLFYMGKMRMNKRLRKKIIKEWKKKGVSFIDEDSVFFDEKVEIEEGVVVYPNNHLYGDTVIKKGAIIKPNNIITDSIIGEECTVLSSVIEKSTVGKKVSIGPNAHLRPNSIVEDNCRIGNFVEIKNALVKTKSKVSHLTYVGDAEIGENCNIGCGVIFVNYNGQIKQKSVIGDNCFIGSNCNVIAPVEVGKNSFIAAGTTLTKSVEKESFIIGRARQEKNDKLAQKYIKKD